MADGRSAPKYHAWSRPKVVEREATHRAIALAELVDQPIQVFHVSCSEVAEEIARAQARGLKVWARDLPAILRARRRRHGSARASRARSSCAARARATPRPARRYGGRSSAARWTWSRPTTAARATRASGGKRIHGNNAPFPRHPERRAGPRPRGCRSCSARAWRKGRIDLNNYRAADRDQSGQAVRAVSAQGHASRRGRTPTGAVGSGQEGHHHQRADAARDRLHAVRGAGGDRLAGGDGARAAAW